MNKIENDIISSSHLNDDLLKLSHLSNLLMVNNEVNGVLPFISTTTLITDNNMSCTNTQGDTMKDTATDWNNQGKIKKRSNKPNLISTDQRSVSKIKNLQAENRQLRERIERMEQLLGAKNIAASVDDLLVGNIE